MASFNEDDNLEQTDNKNEDNISNQLTNPNEFTLISNKDNKFEFTLRSDENELTINAQTIIDNVKQLYSKTLSVEDLSSINYFKKFGIESMEEMVEEIRKFIKDNNPNVIEFTNLILLNIPTGTKKIPDILINLDYIVNFKEKILDLESSNKLLNEEIKELKQKVCELTQIINQFQYTKKKIKNAQFLYEVKAHDDQVVHFFMLSDGRICTSSVDSKIKIFSKMKKTFKEDICIENNDKEVDFVFELKDNTLVSCSKNGFLYFFEIKNNNYTVKQAINAHLKTISKGIELPNGTIVTVSLDKDMKFWKKDEKTKKYENILKHTYNDLLEDIIILNDKEFVFASFNLDEKTGSVEFYNYKTNEKGKNLDGFDISFWSNKVLHKYDDRYLFLGGCNCIFIIDVIKKEYINNIKTGKKICCFCKLSEEVFLCGDADGNLIQIKFKEIEMIGKIISLKEKAHNSIIYTLEKYDEEIISCSKDNLIKIWKY